MTRHSKAEAVMLIGLLAVTLLFAPVSAANVTYPQEYYSMGLQVEQNLQKGMDARRYEEGTYYQQLATVIELRRQTILLEKQNELLAEQNELLRNASRVKYTCTRSSGYFACHEFSPVPI